MGLPIQKIKIVESNDWDKLVRETYGKPYCFQQQDGCKERQLVHLEVPMEPMDFPNHSIPEVVNGEEMGVSFEAWLARDPKEPLRYEDSITTAQWEIELFWNRNFYPDVSMIINDLYAKGLIEEGPFTINIDW